MWCITNDFHVMMTMMIKWLTEKYSVAKMTYTMLMAMLNSTH